MKLIVGLGNPGEQYDGTRHNIGFAVVDEFAKMQGFPKWSDKKDLRCLLSSKVVGKQTIIIIKPTTFMNSSGEAAAAVQHFYKINNSHTIIVYDELDMPLGQLRTRTGGGSAGHNGIKSLIAHFGDDFGRLRIGVANEHSAAAQSDNFVLSQFNKTERSALSAITHEAITVLSEYIHNGELSAETRTIS